MRLVGGIRRTGRALDGGRQGEPGRPREHDSAGGELGADVVGERLHHHAMGRGERAELDEVLVLDEAARGAERGHHHELIAGLGIVEPVQPARLVERDGDARACRPDDVAADGERPGRLDHLAADHDRPGRPVGGGANQPRPFELDAHHRRVGAAGERRALDGAAAIALSRDARRYRRPARACRRGGTRRRASAPRKGTKAQGRRPGA